MSTDTGGRWRYIGWLTTLLVVALLLVLRMVYLFLADSQRFPINTVKISASYQHITRHAIEATVSRYLQDGFFMIPVTHLEADLKALDWTLSAKVERVWPDMLTVELVEKQPIAIWNGLLMAADGALFEPGQTQLEMALPQFSGPSSERLELLQRYQTFCRILSQNGLSVSAIELRDNLAWELSLTNGMKLYLGKRDLEHRLLRFSRVYSLIFSGKPEQVSSVDLRYARGMAVQWKQQTGK